ncbi:hypothetical protein AHF37_08932 [Paragonimus kellicotti]|nr:hypothetical protein AHF37_08932 [Paragonimus kellicotti]
MKSKSPNTSKDETTKKHKESSGDVELQAKLILSDKVETFLRIRFTIVDNLLITNSTTSRIMNQDSLVYSDRFPPVLIMQYWSSSRSCSKPMERKLSIAIRRSSSVICHFSIVLYLQAITNGWVQTGGGSQICGVLLWYCNRSFGKIQA